MKCRYRHCDKIIPEHVNGHRKYCPPIEGSLSCNLKEKNLREIERNRDKSKFSQLKAALQKTLYDITTGHVTKRVTFDRFFQLFQNHLDLFTVNTIKDKTYWVFENFELYKVLHDNKLFIEINKIEKHGY